MRKAFRIAGRVIAATVSAFPAFLLRLTFWARRTFANKTPTSKTLLIVRVDAIGDYILFRNVLRWIKDSSLYDGYSIYLLGNVNWKPVAETLDAEIFDGFFWIDPTKYSRSGWYRAKVAHGLVPQAFDTIVQPAFSRTHWNDTLVRDLTARVKIAGAGDKANNKFHFDISKRTYTQLIPVERDVVLFEFQRNKEFMERLLGIPIPLKAPIIDKSRLPEVPRTSETNTVVFHMDASRREKEWPLEFFARLAGFVVESFGCRVVLLGKVPETESTAFQPYWDQIDDLRGKTTLLEAATILSRARCFVGNDSSLLHIALAVRIPGAIGICFGQHFGRFVPYPESAGRRQFFVFPPAIMDRLSDADGLKKKYSSGNFEDITKISLEMIVEKVKLCFQDADEVAHDS